MAVTSSPSPATDARANPFGWFLGRALLAGVAGGLAGAVFLWLVVEPVIRLALEVEATRPADAAGHAETFGRGVQVVGGMLAAVLYGVLLATIFGVVFMTIRHRMAVPTDFLRSLALAGCAFAAVGLVPALKYPANPPAVGDPDTVGQRTVLYLILLAYGVVVVFAAWRWAGVLRARGTSQPARVTLVGVAVVAVVGLAYAVLPPNPDAVPSDVPAEVLWRFRIASLAGLAVVWATIGLVFGWLCTVPGLRRRG
ncbi:MAG: CbtA family protein [Acidimicrobiales bacterium]